jgi:ribosomal protein L30E
MSDTITQIQNALAEHKALFGIKEVKKVLKTIKVIYVVKNVGDKILADLEYYATLSKVPVEKLDMTNEELSILCKKPYFINVLSVLK